MCDLLLKNGYQVDELIFTDTFLEFGLMYEYLERLKTYFKDRYGKDITVLKPMTTFEEWCFGVIKKESAKEFGSIRGIPNPAKNDTQCYHRRETKIKPLEKYLKDRYQDEEIVSYVGYTLGEGRSIKDHDNFKYIYPLKDYFKMTEEDCKAYLINQEMENPLYRYFSRTGCAICPFQSERSFFQIWKNFPEIWERMKFIESVLFQYEKMGFRVLNKFWFTGRRACDDMEKVFKKTDKQGSFYDFSDDPIKDCFCKI